MPTVEISMTRPRSEEVFSANVARVCSAAGRVNLFWTGTFEGLAGLCFTQHGCCAPQGISVRLTAMNRTGTMRAPGRGQQE